MTENPQVVDYEHANSAPDARNNRKTNNRNDRRAPPGRSQNADNQQWQRKDFVKEKLDAICGPTINLTTKDDPSARKFSGRCRLFVGNLPTNITEDDFRKMFEKFGELGEVFLNKQNGFGFIRLDTRQNAENARNALDFTMKDGKQLRVRFATHGAALKIKNLPPWVSNELLETAFGVFGDIERAIVVVDDRERPIGEGIVEFTRKQSAQTALKRCSEGCFLLTSSPRPVVVEPLDHRDEDDGLPEKNFQKTNKQYLKEREIGPRLAEPGTFEYDFANRWKQLYGLEKQKRDHLEKEIEEGRRALADQMDFAIYDHEANLLRERLRQMEEQSVMIQREKELRREEERRREEARRQQEMLIRRQEEDLLRNSMRRYPEEKMMMQDSGIPKLPPGSLSQTPSSDPSSIYSNSAMPGSGMGPPPVFKRVCGSIS
nr:non-POU domain-containing octamer-binding protein isoform X2 [Parasteatoda tepidariorum]